MTNPFNTLNPAVQATVGGAASAVSSANPWDALDVDPATVTEIGKDVVEAVTPGLTDEGKAPGLSKLFENIPDVTLSVSEDAVAAALGFANGLSLGTIGFIMSYTPAASWWNEIREANPNATNFGEIASIFTPGLLLKLGKLIAVGVLKGGRSLLARVASQSERKAIDDIVASMGGPAMMRNVTRKQMDEALEALPNAVKAKGKAKAAQAVQKGADAILKAGEQVGDLVDFARKAADAGGKGALKWKAMLGAINVSFEAASAWIIAYRVNIRNGYSSAEAADLATAWALASGVGVGSLRGYRALAGKVRTGAGLPGAAKNFIKELMARAAGYHLVLDTPLNQAAGELIGGAQEVVEGVLQKNLGGPVQPTGLLAPKKPAKGLLGFNNGGSVNAPSAAPAGLLSTVSQSGRDFTVTPDGQVIDDQGNVITNTPAGRNALAKAGAGYTAEQTQATAARQQRNVEGVGNLLSATPEAIVSMLPIIGDAVAAKELYDVLQAKPVNWTLVGILTGGLAVGLIPGVGDAAATAIRKGGEMISKGSKEAIDILRSYDLEVDPNTLGMGGGNIRIVKRGRPAGTVKAQPVWVRMKNADGSWGEWMPTEGSYQDLVDSFLPDSSLKYVQDNLKRKKTGLMNAEGDIQVKFRESDEAPVNVVKASTKSAGRLVDEGGKPVDFTLAEVFNNPERFDTKFVRSLNSASAMLNQGHPVEIVDDLTGNTYFLRYGDVKPYEPGPGDIRTTAQRSRDSRWGNHKHSFWNVGIDPQSLSDKEIDQFLKTVEQMKDAYRKSAKKTKSWGDTLADHIRSKYGHLPKLNRGGLLTTAMTKPRRGLLT